MFFFYRKIVMVSTWGRIFIKKSIEEVIDFVKKFQDSFTSNEGKQVSPVIMQIGDIMKSIQKLANVYTHLVDRQQLKTTLFRFLITLTLLVVLTLKFSLFTLIPT